MDGNTLVGNGDAETRGLFDMFDIDRDGFITEKVWMFVIFFYCLYLKRYRHFLQATACFLLVFFSSAKAVFIEEDQSEALVKISG